MRFQQSACWSGHSGAVYVASFSFRGALVASGGFDGSIRITPSSALDDQLSLVGLGHSLAVSDLSWPTSSPDRLVSTGFDRTVRQWLVSSSAVVDGGVFALEHAHGVGQSVLFADANEVWCGSSRGFIVGLDPRQSFRDSSVCVDNDGASVNVLLNIGRNDSPWWVVSGDAKGRLRFWDRRQLAVPVDDILCGTGTPIAHAGISYALDETDARLITVNSFDNVLRIYCSKSSTPTRLVASMGSQSVQHWPIRCKTFVGEHFSVNDTVAGLPGALMIVSGGADGAVHISDAAPAVRDALQHLDVSPGVAKEFQRLSGHTDRVYGIDVHPTKKMLLSSSADGTVRIWTPKTILSE